MLAYDASTVKGAATGIYTTATFSVISSIDPDLTLSADYCYDNGFSRRPILVLMHGYSDLATSISVATRRRFASLGFFVVVPSLRGRGIDTGTQDDSGREIRDIYDAVARVRSLYPTLVHPARNAICGWSGGGGNAEACLAKVPDLFTTFISYYGISDYGWDAVTSWYVQNPSYSALVASHVGGTPAAVPGNYRARYHTEAMRAQLAPDVSPGPRLYLFHDAADVTVQVPLSDTVRDQLDAAFLHDRYEYRRSVPEDAERYTHGYPDTELGVQASERYWTTRARNADAWTIPPSGRVWVSGWIATRRFEVWLGSGENPKTDADGGTNHAAQVDYVIGPTSTFAIKPVTGTCNARCETPAGTVTASCSLGSTTTVTI